MQPQNRTPDVEQATVQSIPLLEINSSHPQPPPTLVTPVVGFNFIDPVPPRSIRTVLAEASVDQEVAVIVARLKVWRSRVSRASINRRRQACWRIPASELASAFAFVIH